MSGRNLGPPGSNIPGADAQGNALNGSNYLMGISKEESEEENWDDDSEEDSPIDLTGVEKRSKFTFENGSHYTG